MIENATSANGLKELKPEKVASLMTKVDKKLGPDSIGVLTYVPDNLPEVDVDVDDDAQGVGSEDLSVKGAGVAAQLNEVFGKLRVLNMVVSSLHAASGSLEGSPAYMESVIEQAKQVGLHIPRYYFVQLVLRFASEVFDPLAPAAVAQVMRADLTQCPKGQYSVALISDPPAIERLQEQLFMKFFTEILTSELPDVGNAVSKFVAMFTGDDFDKKILNAELRTIMEDVQHVFLRVLPSDSVQEARLKSAIQNLQASPKTLATFSKQPAAIKGIQDAKEILRQLAVDSGLNSDADKLKNSAKTTGIDAMEIEGDVMFSLPTVAKNLLAVANAADHLYRITTGGRPIMQG